MNKYVKQNMIHNYLCRYDLVSEENNKELENVIDRKELFICKIFSLIDSCRIVKSTLDRIVIEIDAEEISHLLDDI